MLTNLYTPTQTHYQISFGLFVWYYDTKMVHCEQGHDLTKTQSECKQIIFTKKGDVIHEQELSVLVTQKHHSSVAPFCCSLGGNINYLCNLSLLTDKKIYHKVSRNGKKTIQFFQLLSQQNIVHPQCPWQFYSFSLLFLFFVVCCCVAGEGSGFKFRWINYLGVS